MSGDPDAVVVDVWLLRAFDMDRKYFRNEKIVGDGPIQEIPGTMYGFYQPVIKKRGKFRSGGASDAQYTKIESYCRDEAKAMGIQPRQMSSMIWAGVRIDQGGDRETHYKTLLRLKMNNLFNVF